MAAKAKYLFDHDFAPGAKEAERPVAPSEHALKLAEAESKGFRDGFAAAEKEGASIASLRAAAAFEQIGDALDRMARGLAAIERRVEIEAIEIAALVGRKLAPELMLREPFAEISALATECLRHLGHAPHIVIRVNEEMHDFARKQLEEIAHARGFTGRLMVVAEPEIALGDCKIEWADGGVVRDSAKTEKAIENAIARHLGARPVAVMPALGQIKPGNSQEILQGIHHE